MSLSDYTKFKGRSQLGYQGNRDGISSINVIDKNSTTEYGI